ncbi:MULTISPECIES: YlbF family regulator [Priestia]|nr:YlbF family regulator [Priestia megaterium]MBW0933386.1 YlbF family regulator [Priestia megaterium]MDC7783716.1 YlbF family regulator [Priestia megaterium]RFB21206.1 YlbF family regulator [Bacillus sp. ALD]RFB33612.1 YlbF family regulator [Bacillus sp. RC]
MDVNLYNMTHDFERVLRRSNEFKSLKSIYREVNADPETKKLFNKFHNLQIELQNKQMTGQKIMRDEIEEVQKIGEVVQKNEMIVRLIEAEQRMNILIIELNKIITKPLQELYGKFEER